MSKLDGNERWKSKMLLTEHVEQYEQQHASKESKIITTEERTMIRDYILLPHMEKMVQKSITDVEYSTNILKRLYFLAGQKILDQIVKDLYRLRRELKKRNIKILTEEQSDLIVYHRYYCRGYEERFGMTRDVMRSEISVQLTKYSSGLATLLKEYPKETK
ncbi:hypothetical protein Back11_17190 [Paenibacillus baekrokdamisoli]|uniref:Uncharacterized protein n=1 Tax=Paenibacillus baekrokdamisoli TaxID=1712516 RepID=A0A3G9JAQ9_9BACL|nr:hypothetical protein [Paenibacillus baekrokdamisoli]MBB3072072.1 hypothetical protein [Paenibacillus baekrokdamisoli]BBH20374.1 hypothetical protein Back11_17190 [Paenibacillus baekrokdamisoli]